MLSVCMFLRCIHAARKDMCADCTVFCVLLMVRPVIQEIYLTGILHAQFLSLLSALSEFICHM